MSHCRKWRNVVQTPKFWRWSKLNLKEPESQEVLESQALNLVSEIVCYGGGLSFLGELFKRLHWQVLNRKEGSQLKRLQISGHRSNSPSRNLQFVKPSFVVAVMTRIRSVHVFGLRKYQASALLRKIISMDSSALRLERLVIAEKDVRHINEQMKKLAFSRLESADLKAEISKSSGGNAPRKGRKRFVEVFGVFVEF